MTVDVDFVAHGVSLKDAFREHAQQRVERLESLAEGPVSYTHLTLPTTPYV